ncbi:MAG: PEP-CTERM sorting domain-containing protein [Planctomycetota bacterium]|nr:PEP-CTERM sorting domain-containing protein [Planctomycetota bacterium]
MLDDVGRFKFVDTTTGIATVNKFGLGGYANLTFRSSNGLFYVTDSQNKLRTMNAIGVVSDPLGQLPQVKGLAFDNSSSLYGYDFDLDELISIDPTTASYTSIGPTGFTLDGPGSQLKFNGGQLMVLLDDNGLGTYGTIDPSTGSGTTLFQNSDYLGHRFTDIVPDGMGGMVSSDIFTVKGEDVYLFDPVLGTLNYVVSIQNPSCDCVPEPTSLASFGLLTIALARKKRRQLVERISHWIGHRKTFKKKQTRRVFIESLEPRMLMTVGTYQCDAPEECLCCQSSGNTVTNAATGFGTTYSQSMGNFSLAPSAVQQANYSANTAVASNGMYGSSRLSQSTPTLVLAGSNGSNLQHIQLPWSGTNIRNFRQTSVGGPLYISDAGGTDQITREGGQFVYRNLSGETIRFRDFSGSNILLRGQFINRSDANGNRLEVTSNLPSGAIAALAGYQANSATPAERWSYSYIATGLPNAGKLLTAEVRRNDSTLLRSTLYTYYNKNDPNGSLGDLKILTVRDGSGGLIDHQYFRYYKSGQADFQFGFNSALKYSFDFDSFQRLRSNVASIDLATDAQIAPYAKEYFRYDTSRRIVRHDIQGVGCTVCTGGIGTNTFNYETRDAVAADYNRWVFKVTQTLPDGNQKIIYENYRRQVMLEVDRILVDAANPSNVGKMWGNYTRYDASTGKSIWKATPSALELPANLATLEQYPDLMNNVAGNLQYVRDNAGVIYVTGYYNSTTATDTIAGGISLYVGQQSLRRGELGSDILQSSTQYFARSVGGLTSSYIASQTQYPNEDLSNPLTTTFQYTFFAGSTAIQSRTTNKPIVVSAQNGSNTVDSTTTVFDQAGRAIWTKDEDGFLTFRAYDPESGAVVREIVDVDITKTADFSALPAGWVTPSEGGLHLKTTDVVDRLGRTIETADPNGNVTYTRYDDVAHSQRVYHGWNTSTNRPTGPTRVTRDDIGGSYIETLTMSAAPAIAVGKPTGTEAVSNIESLSRTYRNAASQITHRDDYFNLDGLTYSVDGNLGTEGVHFYRTRYQYNHQGLPEREQAPNGTIHWRIYDGQRRLVSQWIGTNDTTANGQKWSPTNNTGSSNMVQVSAYEYDSNGVGNGNLTKTTALVGIGTDRVNQFAYDFRDRQVATKIGVETIESESTNRPVMYQVYDNMGRVTSRSQYDGDGVSIQTDANNDGTPDMPNALRRRRLSNTLYDNQSRVFRSEEILVDQSTGAAGSIKLQNEAWYDKRGNTIQTAVASGPATQMRTDGAGRQSVSYVLGNIPSGSWLAASSLSTAIVLSQQEMIYDANGNVIQTIGRERFHDADPTAIGALGTASSGIRARVSTRTSYFDAADRVFASVDLGTNGGMAYTRPATPPAATDTALVSLYEYDEAGRLANLIDPRGIVARTLYDDLGRRTTTIANYTGGAPGSVTDVTTRYTYNASGNVRTIEAVQPAGTPSQVHEYLYEARTASGSAINSNEWQIGIRYPDPITGQATALQQDSYRLNAQGSRISMTNRNGTVHSYGYDPLGRRVSDAVTTLGTGVDGSVRRIDVGFDEAGQTGSITSYDAAVGGNVVNQVAQEFNGFGQLTWQWQSPIGAVDPANTPSVRYGYSLTVGGNHSRPTSITYPDGYEVGYGYDSGIDSAISRLSRLAQGEGGPTLESYRYLGAGQVVERARPEVGITLSMISQSGATGDGGDQYTGLDRFGRLVDQRWFSGSGAGAVDVDRYGYTYDRNSNRLSRSNALQAGLSESYSYDGLNQLANFDRGAGVSSQQWQFDALGNWTTFTKDGTPESRTANAQNEYTTVGGASLGYSANGNLVTDEQGRRFEYDAWNRLVIARSSGGVLLASYDYDGLNRRFTEQVSSDGISDASMSPVKDMFYSSQWQVLEERLRVAGAVGTVSEARFVWSPAYIDAMVLRDRGSERVYALQDGNWNTTGLIAASGVPGKAIGQVIQRMIYNPYGEVFLANTDWTALSAAAALPWQYMFQGLKFTKATGLGYVRNRDYSASLGRFIELDPIGFSAGDNNWYRLVVNSPLNRVDPWGLFDYTVATDTGQDSNPWGDAVSGDVFDKDGFKLWKPHDGKTYWCHGYTFGGSEAANGPFSIWGDQVPEMLKKEGWQKICCGQTQPGDIMVFWKDGVVQHSGKLSGPIKTKGGEGGYSFDASTQLTSKWGQLPLNIATVAKNAAVYGSYACYSKSIKYVYRPCCKSAPGEIPGGNSGP